MTEKDSLTLPTRVGHAGFHQPRFVGWPVYDSLAGKETYTGFMAMASTGRRLTPDQCGVLDDITAVMALGDPRIWPLKVTRLGSCYGSMLNGMASVLLCMRSLYVGPMDVPPKAAQMLQEFKRIADEATRKNHDLDTDLRHAVRTRRYMPGFGVPGRPKDERLPALRKCLENRGGRQEGPYWQLYEKIIELAREERKLEPNIASGMAAVLLDMGFEPAETGHAVTMVVMPPILASAIEGARQTPEVLQCLPEETIEYVGRGARVSPRAAAKNS